MKMTKTKRVLKHGNPTIPKEITSELAEFVGIMLGDGCSQLKSNQITISCGDIDMPYITRYIPDLIENLFSKRVGFRKVAQGSIDCQFASKEVCDYLFQKFKFRSPKINCEIPNNFFNDNRLLKACVRGLIDTDGGVHRHHKNSIQIHFTNKSIVLLDSLRRALIQLGYKPSNLTVNHKEKETFAFYLFTKDVKKYFSEIGSSNPKNVIKFEKWVENGVVPLNNEIVPKIMNLIKK